MRFADIPGLAETKHNLINGVQHSHVAHAQLFYGSEGSPNMAMALAYAAYLNCENPGENDSCGSCPSCIKTDKLVHPDLHFAFPVSTTDKFKSAKDAVCENFMKEWRAFLLANPYPIAQDWLEYYGFENKQGNISKEESRQIIKSLSLKAFEGKYKIMLIWLPEFMNSASANALLKIIEEPPGGTVFLMVCNNYESLLTTITSRTQKVYIPRFSDEELADLLVTRQALGRDEATRVAKKADGSPFEALKLIGEIEEQDDFDFAAWMRSCWQLDTKALNKLSLDFAKISRVTQKAILSQHLTILRNVVLASYNEDLIRIDGEQRQFVMKFKNATSLGQLERLIHEISLAISHLEQNGSAKIIFLDMSLKASMILKAG